jgi:DNA-binding NarL/FixJ family response regulator
VTIPVFVYADDPDAPAVFARALTARGAGELALVDDVDEAAVAVVVARAADEHTSAVVRGIQREGCPKVVAFVDDADDAGVLALVDAGCRAVVRAAEAATVGLDGAAISARLVAAITSAAAGDATVPADVLERLVSLARAPRRIEEGFLNERELQVLRLAADGLDTAEIATRLCYSERTVKNVIHDVTTRLRLRNRSHAVAYALREGLI